MEDKLFIAASNAQAAIIGNADTMREITKSVERLRLNKDETSDAFLSCIASISILHAKALLKELEKVINTCG